MEWFIPVSITSWLFAIFGIGGVYAEPYWTDRAKARYTLLALFTGWLFAYIAIPVVGFLAARKMYDLVRAAEIVPKRIEGGPENRKAGQLAIAPIDGTGGLTATHIED